MRTNNKPVYDHYQFRLFKGFDGSPEGRLTATGQLSDKSFFRVDITIISPKGKKPQNNLTLSQGEAEGILKKISDVVISLEEEAR